LKAAVVYGENDIRIADVDTPSPGPGEVLVKVKGSGVCATDVKILGGTGLPKDLPTILGHEVAGEVASLGDGVSSLTVGQRVAVYPIAVCGECFYCKQGRHSLCIDEYGLAHGIDGGFAEYVVIPDRIVRLNGIIDIGDLPFDVAAMVEPISCCLSAADQCAIKRGDHVLIVGAGPLGLLHTIVSKALGAKVIVSEISDARREKAKEVGADITLNPSQVDIQEEIGKLTKVGADVVIAAVGFPKAVEESLPLVRNGGVFNIFGGTPKGQTITVDPRWLHYGEILLTGTFAASVHHFRNAVQFVQQNAETVSKVISVRCGLDGVLDAVKQVREGTAFKTILMFD
jgi:threonine dehydrogenase-like Zn-dependent dehydrogenase